LFTHSGVALQPALISLTDQRNSVIETLLWNVSKVNLTIGGWVKAAHYSAIFRSLFNPMKIRRIGQGYFPPNYGGDCRGRPIGEGCGFVC
jgi:hypothetical protein